MGIRVKSRGGGSGLRLIKGVLETKVRDCGMDFSGCQ